MYQYDEGPDDLGYSDPNRFICTDPGCNGENCPGDNHITPERMTQQSSWTNAEGEPIMDGAAYRFEQQLDIDSAHEREVDDFYDVGWDDPEPIAPHLCDHPDINYHGKWEAECIRCESTGVVLVSLDFGEPDPTLNDHIVWKVA